MIFDVGMHNGKDTEFYLRKGFRVVAIEPNPSLVAAARERLADFIANERLTILEVAIAERSGTVNFYANQQKDGWSTICLDNVATNERNQTHHEIIHVECVNFSEIMEQFDTPYYLKVDIEGADMLCLKALQNRAEKPKYISVEMRMSGIDSLFDELAHLWVLGYRAFKLVDQSQLPLVRCPYPSREGDYFDVQFDCEMSGPFGEEAPGTWFNIETTLRESTRILRSQAQMEVYTGLHGALHRWLHRRYLQIRYGEGTHDRWYDVHAKLPD